MARPLVLRARVCEKFSMASKASSQEILPSESADSDGDLPILKPKLKIFADAVIAGKSGTQAAIDAGYAVRSAGVTAYKILKVPEVAAYIAAKKSRIDDANNYEATKWRRELINIAHSNVDDFTRLNKDGDLEVDFSRATREQLGAVSSVKVKKRKIYDNRGNVVGEEHQSEFRLWDKLRAAELLGKHSGFLAEPEQKIVVDVADRLLRARARVIGLPDRSGSSGSSGSDEVLENGGV
jgi:phage terminase small subunit